MQDQHYKPLCELVGGVGRRDNHLPEQLKAALSRARGRMRWLAFGLVLSGTQLAAGAASFGYSTRRTSCSSDADLLYRRYRARRSKYLGGEEASIAVDGEEQQVRKLTFDEFHDLVTALRQRDFSRAAAVYKINSDVDALLLLHLLKELRLLAPHLEWVKGGCLRRRKEKELYVEVEKMAERKIDELGEGFVRKTLLPLLVTPGDEEKRKMKASSSSFFYPRGLLRHCFEFAKEERTVGSAPDEVHVAPDNHTSEDRVNRYLCWRRLNPFAFFVVPLLSAARWYMLSDVGVVQAASNLLSKFTTGAGMKNLNRSIQQVVIPRAKTGLWGVLRLYLHGVNAAVLSYAAYYGVWQYLCITGGTTTAASPPPSAASRTKVRVLPEEGILWRSKPLWFAFAGDDSSCGASEVFFAPGDNRAAKFGEIVENGEVVVNANGEEWLCRLILHNSSNLLTDFLFRGPLHAVKCAVLRGRIFAFCAQLALVSVVAFPREILQLVLPLLEQSVEAHVKSYLVDFFHTSPWASNVVSRNLFRVGNRVFATLRRLAERSAAAVETRLLSTSRSFGFLDLSSSSADRRWRNLQLVFASTTVFAALSLDLVLNVVNHCFQARRTLEGGRVRWRGFVVGNPDRIELLRNVWLSLAFVCGGAGTVLVKWAFSTFLSEEKKEENEVSMGNEEPRFGGGQGGKDRKKADHGDGEQGHRQNDPAIRTGGSRREDRVDEAEGFLSPINDGDGDVESSDSFVDVVLQPIDPLRTALAVVSTCMGSVISLETARLLFDDVFGFGGDAARANLRDFAALGVRAGEEAANAEVLEGSTSSRTCSETESDHYNDGLLLPRVVEEPPPHTRDRLLFIWLQQHLHQDNGPTLHVAAILKQMKGIKLDLEPEQTAQETPEQPEEGSAGTSDEKAKAESAFVREVDVEPVSCAALADDPAFKNANGECYDKNVEFNRAANCNAPQVLRHAAAEHPFRSGVDKDAGQYSANLGSLHWACFAVPGTESLEKNGYERSTAISFGTTRNPNAFFGSADRKSPVHFQSCCMPPHGGAHEKLLVEEERFRNAKIAVEYAGDEISKDFMNQFPTVLHFSTIG
eukprot:g14600.t1